MWLWFIAIIITTTVSVFFAVVIAIDIAVATSVCKLVGYITRHRMVANHSLHEVVPWGMPLALGSTHIIVGRLLYLLSVGISPGTAL